MRIRRKMRLVIMVGLVAIGFASSYLVDHGADLAASAYVKSGRIEKVVYFTFDDGPSERYTPQVLDILGRYGVPATFFVLGNRCQAHPELVRRMFREGHEIGSHGYDHRFILHQSAKEISREVRMADEAIYRACGAKPVYYRPPGGLAKQSERSTVEKLGHPIAMWTVDSNDWRATSAESIIRTVERDVRPGAIVLFHDGVSGSRYTVQALPKLIRDFRRQGYQFRRLPLK
ncbi:MAG: polysaccharide deacetylase family protein [Alicyclobacillus sp.]|nr:polysaccharide deacetylase family protein [Alicyclobacillus sp.]